MPHNETIETEYYLHVKCYVLNLIKLIYQRLPISGLSKSILVDISL